MTTPIVKTLSIYNGMYEEAARELRAHIAALEAERDEWRTQALDRDLQITRLTGERDAALADNAEHVRLFRGIQGHTSCDSTAEAVHIHLATPHPGAALLEELETLRGVRAQAQVDAKFIHEALGWAGEWPTSLPAPSRAVVALLEKHREELAAAARRHETTRATMAVREDEHRKSLDEALAKERTYRDQRIREAEVRARNEGLEKAARATDAEADEWDGAAAHDGDPVSHEANAIRGTARRIRALKEPDHG